MGNSAFKLEQSDRFKLSYSGPGILLEKDVYPLEVQADKKRSILRSIVSRKAKKSKIHLQSHTGLKTRLGTKMKDKIQNTTWSGLLSEWEDLRRHNYLNCGFWGVLQQNAKGERRKTVYHCNQIKLCPVCSNRYHKGRALERTRRVSSIMLANDVKYLRKMTLTFPEFIRDQIKTPEQLQSFKRAANELLQEFYGCQVSKKHTYKNGSVGVSIDTHWYSSKEAWKLSPHLHCSVIPLKIEKGNVTNVEFFIKKSDRARLKARWASLVKEVAFSLSFTGLDAMPGSLVIHHKAVDVLDNLSVKGHPGLNFTYDQRSPAFDLEDSIAAVDLNQELMVMGFEKEGLAYYAIWSFNDYVKELLTRLNLKATNSTYGWLRRFKANALALGIDIVDEEDTFEPVPELDIKVNFRRSYRKVWDNEAKRLIEVKHLSYKVVGDPDKPEYWKSVDPWKIHGEEIWTGSKKRHSYKFPPLKSGV